jgi:competence protein ComEC
MLLALAACAGIGVADALPRCPAWAWLGAAAAAAVLTARWPGRSALLALCAAVFAFAHHARDRDPLREQLAGVLRPGGAVPAVLEGVVADAPEPDASGRNFSFPLKIESLKTTLIGDVPAGSRLYVHTREFPATLRYGDRISLTGLLRRPAAPRNPGEFDLPSFLRRQGYSAEFEASAAGDRLTVIGRDAGSPVMAAALRMREWIGETVTADIADDADLAATVRAMVLGTREKTPAEVEDAFVASGTMHVFAVSGLHVAMFCAILWVVLRMLRLPRAWIVAIALPIVFFYVFITGLRPSAWRAALMAAVVMGAPLFNRESGLFNGLGAAALLLLGWDTQQLFQPGFTLSFGVLLALALLHPFFRRLLRPVREADPFLPRQLYSRRLTFWLRIRAFLADSLSVSMASMLGSSLLMIYYFGIVTPIGIIANLFLVGLSLGILALACASLVTAAIGLVPLSFCFNQCNWLLALTSVKAAQFFAGVPGGHFHCDAARLWRGDPCEITVLQLDSGGAAVHVDTPDGRHWLIDTGGKRHFLRTVRPHLSRTPVNRLDGVLFSHRDAYHTGALSEVQRVFRPLREPALAAGRSLLLAPGVRLDCLFPPPGWKAGPADDRCAVFMLACRGVRILFMNDAGFVTEKALLAGGADLDADILVKGRHGSDYSGLPEFINAVRPECVVFTNGDFPASEIVAPEWKRMLQDKGIRFFDQARSGAVIIRIDDDATRVRAFCEGTEKELPRTLP